MKHGKKNMRITHCAQHPKKGVKDARMTAPKSTARAPSENWPYRAKPAGNGGSTTYGNVSS